MHLLITNCFLFLLLIQAFPANCCIEHERQALLKFKGSLNDPSNRLASWRGDKCCNWAGIRCSNQTGHVVKLDLQDSEDYWSNEDWSNHSLSGKINPDLVFLSDLEYLDLSYNNFSRNRFPEFLGSFRNLKCLNLSSTGLSGLIPPHLGNLSKLQHLKLCYNPNTFVSNVHWLSHLSSLNYLDMSELYFRDSKEWLQTINMLPHLHTLRLADNGLITIPTFINSANFTSLEVLDIRGNCFNTKMPDWIGKLTNLKELTLSDCCFIGPVPNKLGNLTSLEDISLRDEFLEGPMPPLNNLNNLTHLWIEDVDIREDIGDFMRKLSNDTLYKLIELELINTNLTGNLIGWLSKMRNIKFLDLSYNNLNGTIPTDVGNLTHLVGLFLGGNSFTGELSEIHLNGLSNLTDLSLEFNFINFTVGTNWTPPFQLELISLDRCKLGPYFPSWLRNQSHILEIGLSNNEIVDTVPDWFWNFPSLISLNLSNNVLSGRLPLNLKHLTQLDTLLLQNNQFEGMIPYLPNSLLFIDLSVNLFHGNIEQLLCGIDSLIVLNLKKNNLFGNLLQCWPKSLEVISLADNRFSGSIPDSISNSSSLLILKLNSNSITGDLPSTLESIQNLTILDIGKNKLSGQLPEWIGKSLTNLEVLRLPFNMLSGEIPFQIMHMPNLQVLDISSNQLSGSIPNSTEFMLAMTSTRKNNNNSAYESFQKNEGAYYEVSISVITKGLYLDYSKTLSLIRSIDLSSNNLIGEIPPTITTLHGLESLNLSNNNLHGSIPSRIGDMQSIESLDLRTNGLSGTIPHSLSNLIFLTTLNLSYNNLSGEIPTGNQLQTLDNPYIYIGNAYLCGSPSSKSCNTSQTLYGHESESNNYSDNPLMYLFAVIVFGIGFWLVCGTLLCNVKWRYCFFRAIDNDIDWLFVFCVVYVGRLFKDVRKNHE